MLLGLGLIKIGFLPKRRGTTPHCRGCGYALIGNQSGTCPECGREFSEATVDRGERHRQKGIGFAGVTMLLLGLAIGGGAWLTDIDWYRYLPERWVVKDAGSSNPTTAKRAWDELLRRRAIAPLAERTESRLTDLALREQAAPSPRPMIQPMVEFLAARYVDKKLTDQQADQFFLNCVNPSLHTRDEVAAGDVIPIQVSYRGRGPSNGWSYQLRTASVKVGTTTIQMGGSLGGSGLGGSGSSTTYAPGQPPGEYPLEANITVQIYHAPLGSAGKPTWSKDLTLKSTLKVLPKNAGDMVKLVDKPELADRIKKCLRVDQFNKNPDGRIELGVQLEKPPVNVAFSIFAKVGDKEVRVGDVAGDTSTNGGTFMSPSEGDIPPGKMQLILRSDPAVARKTINLVEIWKGEIVLEAELKEKGK
jgi:hypothetical protein